MAQQYLVIFTKTPGVPLMFRENNKICTLGLKWVWGEMLGQQILLKSNKKMDVI
jgi:hypothetical protein